LFIAHGAEELMTGFYNMDSHVKFMFGFVESLTPLHAAFLVFQIMLWLMLIVSYLLLRGEKWQLRLMAIPGLVMVYELHHIYKAIVVGGYYPGLITALFFPIIGLFFWKEYLNSLNLNPK
jgi:hypothetical protein